MTEKLPFNIDMKVTDFPSLFQHLLYTSLCWCRFTPFLCDYKLTTYFHAIFKAIRLFCNFILSTKFQYIYISKLKIKKINKKTFRNKHLDIRLGEVPYPLPTTSLTL